MGYFFEILPFVGQRWHSEHFDIAGSFIPFQFAQPGSAGKPDCRVVVWGYADTRHLVQGSPAVGESPVVKWKRLDEGLGVVHSHSTIEKAEHVNGEKTEGKERAHDREGTYCTQPEEMEAARFFHHLSLWRGPLLLLGEQPDSQIFPNGRQKPVLWLHIPERRTFDESQFGASSASLFLFAG